MQFNPDGSVRIDPLGVSPDVVLELQERSLLFYTGRQRCADSILEKQTACIDEKFSVLSEMRDIAGEMCGVILRGNLDEFARLLNASWELKRSLGCGITNERIDAWGRIAKAAGAQAGKLLGAGGGGFLFLLAPTERQEAIRAALGHPPEVKVRLDVHGTRIVLGREVERSPRLVGTGA
jgi:D-glycero-alpha-D-manno-heptose-7-phosphate kinase